MNMFGPKSFGRPFVGRIPEQIGRLFANVCETPVTVAMQVPGSFGIPFTHEHERVLLTGLFKKTKADAAHFVPYLLAYHAHRLKELVQVLGPHGHFRVRNHYRGGNLISRLRSSHSYFLQPNEIVFRLAEIIASTVPYIKRGAAK